MSGVPDDLIVLCDYALADWVRRNGREPKRSTESILEHHLAIWAGYKSHPPSWLRHYYAKYAPKKEV